MADAGGRRPLGAVLRGDTEKVRFLELFFDLVFVLGFTQCTALMVHEPSWTGIVHGLFVLAMLWWAWAGYAWLTSVVDPEEGGVRIAMFAVMAALLVVALAVPGTFGELALTFALAYGAVRIGHIALFALASRGTPDLRHSVATLSVSTVIAIGLLTAASFVEGIGQEVLWAVAITIDFGGPALFGVEGWRLVPAHFAERHGLIIILALGESIVVLGVGASAGVTAGVIVAAVLGVALASALWWTYFDVVASVTEQRLTRTATGRERNALARDSYSYLHFPMAAGIVLVAVGLENTLAHVDEPLEPVAAFALLGGVALYLLAHVALRLRNAHSVNRQRLALAIVLLVLVPLGTQPPAPTTLAAVTAVLWLLIAYETRSYGSARDRVRHPMPTEHGSTAGT
ncbi:MAG: low temperature requirement protein A [Actinobacteria bacterium]|nr:low temperature requirement protein A [Actinomycetota bacterium]